MFLLDTNVVSELRRPERAHANVAAWASGISHSQLFISVVTILEIEAGVLLQERRDPAHAAVLRCWLEERVVPGFGARILTMDMAIARRCAHLDQSRQNARHDTMIAATALVHGLTLVTRNVRDFAGIGVSLLNPWAPEEPIAPRRGRA